MNNRRTETFRTGQNDAEQNATDHAERSEYEVTEHDFIPAQILNVATVRKARAFIATRGTVIFSPDKYLIICGKRNVFLCEKIPALDVFQFHIHFPLFI